MSINVGLIGGGIWAREEHAPAIEAADHLNLKAVYSRTNRSAQSIADVVSSSPDLYSDESGKTFETLLERSDIDAVVISLPIANQPYYIKAALKAGKHVLSEKPVAENVKDAVDLIRWYRSEIKGSTWSIGENWRFLESYKYAARQLPSLGKITSFQGRQHADIELDWKFNLTEWRRTPTHQGGYLLDGGVHYIAGLRLLLGTEPNNEIAKLSSFTGLTKDYLPPVDTADVILQTRSGVTGVFQISRGTSLIADEWTIATEKGWIKIEGERVTISRGNNIEVQEVPNERTGVPPEIRAWGEAIIAGKLIPEQEPEASLSDLEIVELLLRSGEEGGVPQATRYQ